MFRTLIAVLATLSAWPFLVSATPLASDSIIIHQFSRTASSDSLSIANGGQSQTSSAGLWAIYEKEITDTCMTVDAAIRQLKARTDPGALQTATDSIALIPVLNRLNFLNNRSYRLHAVLENLQRLKNSSVRYRVVNISGVEGRTAYDKTTGEIVFYVLGAASFVHETAHGGQFEDRKIAYLRTTGAPFGNDLQDEIEAYCWQFAFDPGSVLNLQSTSVALTFAGITEDWVKHLRLPDGSMPYSEKGSAQLARKTISVDSRRKLVIRAYRFLPQIKQLPAGWKITNDPNIYYKGAPGSETASTR